MALSEKKDKGYYIFYFLLNAMKSKILYIPVLEVQMVKGNKSFPLFIFSNGFLCSFTPKVSGDPVLPTGV